MKQSFKQIIMKSVLALSLLGAVSYDARQNQAQAFALPCIPCIMCGSQRCADAQQVMQEYYQAALEDIFGKENEGKNGDYDDAQEAGGSLLQQFHDFETWLENFTFDQVLPALQMMTTQITVVAMQQVYIVGTFFDAQIQMETHNIFARLRAEAKRDYHPSEDFCWFGTNVRSMASTENRARYMGQVLNERQMARQLGRTGTAASSQIADKRARWEQFVSVYCDPYDNNYEGRANSGLMPICNSSGNEARANLDIDYGRLLEQTRTLDIKTDPVSHDFQDVLALASNLYGHEVLARNVNASYLEQQKQQENYLAMRSVAARRNVAENSFNALVEFKTSGPETMSDGEASNTYEYLSAVLKGLGVPDDQLISYIGERPSYYAQLEILAKKIYQNPDFYANLYDKPANVKRKSVALRAIELMVDRAIYESQIRREMATSVLLSTELNMEKENIVNKIRGGR